MNITKEEVFKIAEMSRIAINDQEVDEIATHFRDVINYAERITTATQLSEPQSFYYNVNVFREDQPIESDPQKFLAQAPQEESGLYVVPAVLEQE